MKPKERPNSPNMNERPLKFADENKWLWELIESLRERLKLGIEPLQEYMNVFDKFKKIL